MKKIYLFLALCLMGSVSMLAKDYYTVDGLDGDRMYASVKELKVGEQYFIANPRSNGGYFTPTGLSSALSSSALYEFVEFGTDAKGAKTYILKNVESGKYFDGSSFTGYTTKDDRAWVFTAMPAQVFNAVQNENGKYEVNWDEYEWDPRTATQDYDTNSNYVLAEDFVSGDETAYVFCEANSANGNYICCYGGLASYKDTNCWYLAKPKKLSGYDAMEPCANDIFGEGGEFNVENYTIGTGPGEYSAAAVEAMQKAYEEFMNLYNNGGTDEQCNAAIAALQEAWENLQKSMGALTDGQYYRFWNWRDGGSYQACMYDDGTNVRWTQNYTAPEQLDTDGAVYVWRLVQKDGKNYFQNYYTGRFLSDVNGMSQVFPTTATAQTSFVISSTDEAGAFNIRGEERNENWGMHTQVNGLAVVYWNAGSSSENQGSLWRVETMPAEQIEALESQLAQARLNQELKEALGEANATYNKGFSYKQYLNSVEEQMTFNRSETGEGSEAAIHDGDPSTYYHSFWSQSGDMGQPHWFQVQMEEPVSELVFDITRRGINANKNGAVTRWVIVGTNDESVASDDVYESGDFRATLDAYKDTWATYEEFAGEYDQQVIWNGTTYNNALMSGEVKFATPVKYVRFLAAGRMGDTFATEEQVTEEEADPFLPYTYGDTPASNIYMCVGELVIRSKEVDKETSLIYAIPEAVRTRLEAAIAKAKEELAAGAATQATIDELRAAYKAFLEVFPEPEVVKDLVADVRDWVENSVTGTDEGCYAEGAVEALAKAADAAEGQVKDVMTMDEINAVKKQLDDALAAFHAQLVLPAATNCMIISQSEGAAGQSRMFARRPGHSTIGWGAYDEEEGTSKVVEDLQAINYLWRLERGEGRTFQLFNYGTGCYVAAVDTVGPAIKMTTEKAEALNFTLQGSRTEVPAFNIVCAPGVFINFQPGGQAIVTWGSAKGYDNSAVTFEEFDAEDWGDKHLTNVEFQVGVPQVVTFPYEVSLGSTLVPCYSLLGQDANGDYQFKQYTDGAVVPAATPILMYTEEDEGYDSEEFELTAESLGAIKYVTDAAHAVNNQNGMVGVLEDVVLPEGCGFFHKYESIHHLVATDAGEGVLAGQGYFVVDTKTEVKGDLTIVGSKSITATFAESTGINQATVIDQRISRGTFNLMGQKVEGKLPAGLYIVNGKKYLVK